VKLNYEQVSRITIRSEFLTGLQLWRTWMIVWTPTWLEKIRGRIYKCEPKTV
jgi:hypothetical protein